MEKNGDHILPKGQGFFSCCGKLCAEIHLAENFFASVDYVENYVGIVENFVEIMTH